MQAVLNTVIGVLIVLTDLAFVWVTKMVIDVATHVRTDITLRHTFMLLVSIMLLQVLLGVALKWIRAVLGVRARNDMQQQLFAHLMACCWMNLKQFHTGNLVNRLERDVSDVIGFLTENIPAFITTLTKFIGAFFILFYMDSTLAAIVVLIVPFFLLTGKLYVKKMRKLSHRVREAESRIQASLQESLQHSMVIKTLGRVDAVRTGIAAQQKELRGEVVRKTKYSTFSSTLMNVGFATGYLVTFIWGAVSLERGAITYGAMLAFIQLVGQIQGPVRNLTQFIPVFIGAFTATERLMELFEVPREESRPDALFNDAAGIRLDHVCFKYAAGSRSIFKDFTFDFPPGSITAILGETGAGKTTLIRMLLALVSPTRGSVCLYDKKGGMHPAAACTRCNFSYVPQGNTLLSGTVRSNLLLGNPEADETEMIAALKCAAAHFVFDLPDGLDTCCGEGGNGFSEGQAQRIAIARALLKKSPIYLFDEATSSLDAATEKEVLENIIGTHPHTTLIFITHRPEVLNFATQQLKLERV